MGLVHPFLLKMTSEKIRGGHNNYSHICITPVLNILMSVSIYTTWYYVHERMNYCYRRNIGYGVQQYSIRKQRKNGINSW